MIERTAITEGDATMTNYDARLARLERMIASIREFAADDTLIDSLDDAPADLDRTAYAIDALADDIHDCAADEYETANNPHEMNETEFDLLADLLAAMTD